MQKNLDFLCFCIIFVFEFEMWRVGCRRLVHRISVNFVFVSGKREGGDKKK